MKTMPGARSPASLGFGVVSGDTTARASLGILCTEIGRLASRIVYPQILTSYSALADEMRRGSLDLAWAPPLIALELDQARSATIGVCSRRQSGNVYHSVLFGRRGLGVSSVGELEGRHAAWVDKDSLSGYLFARQWIRARGLDLDRLFASQSFRRTHSEVARAVLDGQADVGATYANLDPRTQSVHDAGWFEIGAGLDAVEVIATIGPIPADTIVVSSSLTLSISEALIDALTRLPSAAQGAMRSLFHAEGFERATPEHQSAVLRLRELR